MSELKAKNTDKHLFYEDDNDEGYSPSCHMTQDRKLGIHVGGYVTVMSLREWQALEQKVKKLEKECDTLASRIIEEDDLNRGYQKALDEVEKLSEVKLVTGIEWMTITKTAFNKLKEMNELERPKLEEYSQYPKHQQYGQLQNYSQAQDKYIDALEKKVEELEREKAELLDTPLIRIRYEIRLEERQKALDDVEKLINETDYSLFDEGAIMVIDMDEFNKLRK